MSPDSFHNLLLQATNIFKDFIFKYVYVSMSVHACAYASAEACKGWELRVGPLGAGVMGSCELATPVFVLGSRHCLLEGVSLTATPSPQPAIHGILIPQICSV